MKRIVWMFGLILALYACDSNESDEVGDDFDRGAMLTNWADNIIIPAYTDFNSQVTKMDESILAYTSEPTLDNLVAARTTWQTAYISWQTVAMFQIGAAERIDMQGYLNTFPTDQDKISELIAGGLYDLTLASRRNVQGFPAIDYLLNGIASSDEELLTIYSDQNSIDYLITVSARVKELSDDVLADWNGEYRNEFVANSGSSATSAVNKLTNDFIYFFEGRLRTNKVSMPSGVFSGSPDTQFVEAFYRNDISKQLFEAGLKASVDFFNGIPFDGSENGECLATYLDFLNTIKEGEDLSQLINDQFGVISNTNSGLLDSYSDQIDQDVSAMFGLHEQLQKNVIYFKVDMVSALNIRVDYVDADGD
ncbi:MAG: imelysin family protein [Reichenbachiella sp.]